MAAPTTYVRQFNFDNYQALNPASPLPANQVEAELNAIKITADQIINNLGLIQRADNQLANQSVGFDQLKPEVRVGVQPAEAWTTARSYIVGSTVFVGSDLYRCLIAHISGVFATDLAAAKWLFIATFTGGGGGVISSVFGRTGAVVAVAADYTASLITNAPAGGIAAVTVQAAINELDVEKANLASPTLTGIPLGPTAAADTNTTQLASTAFMLGQASSITPLMDGIGAAGASFRFSRQDHIHPTDTSRAPVASPTFTGVPAAPTAAPGDNTTQLATTAFATLANNLKANLASPALTGVPTAPTAPVGNNTTQLATTAFVLANVGTGVVTSVFGRVGAVVGANGDFNASQITNTPAGGIAAITVQNALNELDTKKANLASPTFTGIPAAPTAAPGTNTTQIASTAYTDAAVAAGPSGADASTYAVRGLNAVNNAGTPLTQMDVTYTECVMRTSIGVTKRFTAGTGTINWATAGPAALGRDQAGVFSASQWTHVYAIGQVGGTKSYIVSLTPPTTVSGPALPAGYTYWAYLFSVYWNAASNLLSVTVRGNHVYYNSGQGALSNGGATVQTAVSLANSVPPNASSIDLSLYASVSTNAGGGGSQSIDIRHTSGVRYTGLQVDVPAANYTISQQLPISFPNVGQNFYYIWSNAASPANISSFGAYVNVLGYSVPNGDS